MRRLALASPLLVALLATAAYASFPGTTKGELEANPIAWVLAADPSAPCIPKDVVDQESFDDSLDARNANGEACIPDFIENAELRGLVTLVIDDDASDQGLDCPVRMASLTVILELEAAMGKRRVLAESFAGCVDTGGGSEDAGLVIDGWENANDPTNEEVTFNALIGNSLVSDGFVRVRTEIREFAEQALGLELQADQAVLLIGDPVANVFRKNVPPGPSADCGTGCGPSEEDARGTDSGGSVGRYRITIRFATPAPSPVPE